MEKENPSEKYATNRCKSRIQKHKRKQRYNWWIGSKEPHEIFKQYVNNELTEIIVEETNQYTLLRRIQITQQF